MVNLLLDDKHNPTEQRRPLPYVGIRLFTISLPVQHKLYGSRGVFLYQYHGAVKCCLVVISGDCRDWQCVQLFMGKWQLSFLTAFHVTLLDWHYFNLASDHGIFHLNFTVFSVENYIGNGIWLTLWSSLGLGWDKERKEMGRGLYASCFWVGLIKIGNADLLHYHKQLW